MTTHEKQVFSHRDKMDDRLKQAAKWALKVWKVGGYESLRFRGWI